MIHEPEAGVVLVDLPSSQYGDVPVIEKVHNTRTYGRIIAMHPDDEKEKGYMLGRIGHWRAWKEDAQIENNLAAVEIKDILATSREENE